jgi:hypothetical protein
MAKVERSTLDNRFQQQFVATYEIYKAATVGRGLCATRQESPPFHQRGAVSATTGRGFMKSNA